MGATVEIDAEGMSEVASGLRTLGERLARLSDRLSLTFNVAGHPTC
jgi:hypothetical protein